ncbi:MAG: hypothetical protein IPM54_26125 [Polyangiaceae bacterium]|nr:hypothetical protein [Polyangiaceae bacterium]
MRASLKVGESARVPLFVAAMGVFSMACSEPAGVAPCGGQGVICRVAGTGEAGFHGDGLSPLKSALNLPTAARTGPDGLLYVMDFNNMRLRCIRADDTFDTVVGNGVHTFAVAGADARNTPLENPIDFGFLPDGSVVFVSVHDPRVLGIAADGTVDVIAGTGESGDTGDGHSALVAKFHELSGIAIAPDGTIFVSDAKANRVRVIRPDRTVHAYAGSGEAAYGGDDGPATAAALNHPTGLALDAMGNLYIADTYNQRIRRVDALTGVIETVAGTGTAGLSGDGGSAKAADLQWPNGVSIAPDGGFYLSDTFNHRIRKVDSGGLITTFAGTSRGHAGDGGPASMAQLKGPTYIEATERALYIADTQNHVVRVVWLE